MPRAMSAMRSTGFSVRPARNQPPTPARTSSRMDEFRIARRKLANMFRMSFGRRPTTRATRDWELTFRGTATRRTSGPSFVSAVTSVSMPKRACWTASADVREIDVGPEPLPQRAVGVVDQDEFVGLLVEEDPVPIDLDVPLELGRPGLQRPVEVPVQVPPQTDIGERAEDDEQKGNGDEVPDRQAELDGLVEGHGTRSR